MSDKNFVEGMIVKLPDNSAPEFLKLKLSFKLDEFGAWIANQKRNDADLEWLNVEIKEGRSGKWYAERNMWKPSGDAPQQEQRQPARQPAQSIPKDDIPW